LYGRVRGDTDGCEKLRSARHTDALTLIPILALLLFANEAHAYIDPGTGSLILQLIAGAFLGSLMTVKIWWYRMTGFVSRIFRMEDEESE